MTTPSSRRRVLLLAAALAVVVVGLGVHLLIPGSGAALVADALYAVMVYLLLGVLAPTVRAAFLGLGAWAACAAIELAQLTGVPAQVAEIFPPARLVFGTTFAPWDLVAYAGGALLVAVLDAGWRHRDRVWGASQAKVRAE